MTRINSIWSTPEGSAWSRDFGYDDYVRLHAEYGCTAFPVSETMYRSLCEVFEAGYEMTCAGKGALHGTA